MGEVRYRELTGIRAAAFEPSGGDLSILSSDQFAGRPLQADEVRVGSMLLAHDQYDRSFERFPVPYLRQFAATAPGKAMLPGHDKGALALGRFYRGQVVQRTEEFPVAVLERGKGESEQVPGFEPKKIAVAYLSTDYYFANTPANEQLRANIATGVYKSVSIGYKFAGITCDVCGKDYLGDCPHFAGQWVEKDGGRFTRATATYSGDASEAEMREGSIVWLGAQPNARLETQVRSGEVDPAALAKTPWGDTDLVALKGAEALARIHGHAAKSWAFPALATQDAGISSMEDRQAVGRETGMSEETRDVKPEEKAPEQPASPPPAPAPRPDYIERSEGFRALQRENAQLKSERDAARERLAERETLLDGILQDIGDEILHCAHLLGDSTSRAADFVSRRVEQRDWRGLREEVDDLRERVAVRFPTGTSGNTRLRPEERGPRDLRDYDVV